MHIDELRESVRSVPGVASAEVTTGPNDEPLVRVWTDGSRREIEVKKAVEAVVEQSQRDPADHDEGGDLRDMSVSASDVTHSSDPATTAVVVSVPTGRFTKIAIEESADGVEIRAIDAVGQSAVCPVGDGDDAMDMAVATAISYLNGSPEPTAMTFDIRTIDESQIITVVLDLPPGRRLVGAVLAEGGHLFTLGRAVNDALATTR